MQLIWLLFIHQIVFQRTQIEIIRLELGQHLALGLEFIVGKDIIDSIVTPSWDGLGRLAVLIALRTMLTYFLSREIEHLEHDEKMQKIILKRRNLRVGALKNWRKNSIS